MSALTRRALGLAAILVAALVLVACADTTSDAPVATPTIAGTPGLPRTFAMGISSLPPELTEQSYEDTFALAGSAGEVILIQRTPPWAELIAGHISEETVQTTRREVELAEEHGLDIFVAIDPTDSAERRSRLAGLPEDLRGAGFGDEQVQQAFLAYARYVAEQYQPKYLALGVEINGYQQHHPEDFERFVVLYHQAYDEVKQISPETLVFPTFQLEELQGLLPPGEPLPPQWYVISRFEPRLDLLAVSSYPKLAYETVDDVPESYYAQLVLYTDRPIAISGMGYSSASGEDDPQDAAELGQAAFLQRTLDNAQQLSMPFVIWFVGQDPSFTGGESLDLLQDTGLRRQDGSAKPAWTIWDENARRQLDPVPVDVAEAGQQ